MGHSYNNGLHTSSKGITIDAVRITALNVTVGQPCTIAEDCKSGLITSVTHTATGIYTFQLSVPYPPKYVTIMPQLSATSVTSTNILARFQSGSYNPTTGQFIVTVNNAGTAADAGATDELHVNMHFNRYSR